MSSEQPMIKATDLGKVYHIYNRPADRLKQMLWRGRRQFCSDYWALRGVSLEINRGETVGIVGRNGSGKSTLLQLVCGTLSPSIGELSVTGRVAALLELGAGFNPEFTGRENVYLAAAVLGLSTKQTDERFKSIEEFAAIGDFINQPVKVYSSGMYARLAFAVAAHVDADILIIDEILAVGDVAFTQKCMRFINNFKKTGTILFVSHDSATVVSLCDRVIWLDSGSVREVGDPREVCHNYVAAIHADADNSGTFKIGGTRKMLSQISEPVQDHRSELLNSSNLKNVVEIFTFDPDAPWYGHRGGSVVGVELLSSDGEKCIVLSGGETVELQVRFLAHQRLERPIVGFYLRNKLGQDLFGDNTFLSFRDSALAVEEGQGFIATFQFQMPFLPSGDYSIVIALAEGTQESHVYHHWVDDALFFKVHSSHVARGLIGVPMLKIGLETLAADGELKTANADKYSELRK